MKHWKLGICMWGMPEKGIPAVKKAAELGFAGISMDVSLFDRPSRAAHAEAIRTYQEAAQAYGIAYPSMSVEILNEIGLTKQTGSAAWQTMRDYCLRGIETAAELGVDVLQLPSFNDGAIRSEEAFAQTCETLAMLCREAGKAGVRIASENDLNLELSLRLLEEVAEDQFGILFDTQNYYLNGIENTPEIFRAIAPRVLQVHLKDGVNGTVSNALIGEGESGFYDTAEAIKDAWEGEWLLVETYYDRPPFYGAENTDALMMRDRDTCRDFFGIRQS